MEPRVDSPGVWRPQDPHSHRYPRLVPPPFHCHCARHAGESGTCDCEVCKGIKERVEAKAKIEAAFDLVEQLCRDPNASVEVRQAALNDYRRLIIQSPADS